MDKADDFKGYLYQGEVPCGGNDDWFYISTNQVKVLNRLLGHIW